MYQKIIAVGMAHMLQKQMEGLSMVMMAQMTKFVQQDIVTERGRKPDYIKVQINIVTSRTTAPVGGVMLDDYTVI